MSVQDVESWLYFTVSQNICKRHKDLFFTLEISIFFYYDSINP